MSASEPDGHYSAVTVKSITGANVLVCKTAYLNDDVFISLAGIDPHQMPVILGVFELKSLINELQKLRERTRLIDPHNSSR